MKIATITCHDVYNYGASLQAYALQEYCKQLGYDYKIIDYKPPYLSNHYRLDIVNNLRYDKPLIKQLYLLAKLPGRLMVRSRKRRFDEFTSNYLILTNRRYSSIDDLTKSCPKADIYIAGSDQIWNTLFANGRDPAFYLDFVGSNGRRISYAASFATDKIQNGYEVFVKKMLGNFDAVSVREYSALTILNSLGKFDATLVCDPVFLLEKNYWEKLVENTSAHNKEYIFVYDCEKSPKLGEIARELHRQTGLPIYRVSDIYGRYSSKNFSKSGPIEFLALLKNARYVVANSFHALAFSLIFKKDFFIVKRSDGTSSRIRDLLEYLNLSDRLINSFAEVCVTEIDFSVSVSKLEELIEISKMYLANQFKVIVPNEQASTACEI